MKHRIKTFDVERTRYVINTLYEFGAAYDIQCWVLMSEPIFIDFRLDGEMPASLRRRLA